MKYNLLITRCYESEERPIVKVVPCETREDAMLLKQEIIEAFNATMSEDEKEKADVFENEDKFYFQSKYVMDDIYLSVEESQAYGGDEAHLVSILEELERDNIFYQ